MNAILELEKRGYVFKISAGVLTFVAPSKEYAEKHENELRPFFTEIASSTAQAVAYLLARGLPAERMVAIEDLPAFRAEYHCHTVGFHWQGRTPVLEMETDHA